MKDWEAIESLGSLPKKMTWKQQKGYWLLSIKSPKEDTIRAFGGFLILGVGLLVEVIPYLVQFMLKVASWAECVGYGLLTLLLLLFSFATIVLFISGLRVYGQHLQVFLGAEKVLLVQRTAFVVRQREQIYELAQIKGVELQAIPKKLVNIHTASQQQLLQFLEEGEQQAELGWGYYLSVPQLEYLRQLLQLLYVEEQAPLLLDSEKSLLDLSSHLLEK